MDFRKLGAGWKELRRGIYDLSAVCADAACLSADRTAGDGIGDGERRAAAVSGRI